MFNDCLPKAPADQLHSFMGSIPALYMEEISYSFRKNAVRELRHRRIFQCLSSLPSPGSAAFADAPLCVKRKGTGPAQFPGCGHPSGHKYIYKNFQKSLTLEEVSAVASLSPTYFSRKFKQTTGMGFKEYLNYVRLKHARAALLTHRQYHHRHSPGIWVQRQQLLQGYF